MPNNKDVYPLHNDVFERLTKSQKIQVKKNKLLSFKFKPIF